MFLELSIYVVDLDKKTQQIPCTVNCVDLLYTKKSYLIYKMKTISSYQQYLFSTKLALDFYPHLFDNLP